MLGIILTILKILGISLLVILGIVLFIVLFLVFVPIRYRAKGYFRDGQFQMKFDFYYFFDWISFTLGFEKKFLMYIRLFSKRLYLDKLLKGKKKKKKKGDKQDNQSELANENNSKDDVNNNANSESENDIAAKSEEEESASSEGVSGIYVKTDDSSDSLETSEKDDSEENTEDNIEDDSEDNSEDNIEDDSEDNTEDNTEDDTEDDTEDNSEDKKGGMAKLSEYISILRAEYTKLAFKRCLNKIGLLLKSILPRKGFIDLEFGTGDAGLVGEILGIYEALYIYIGKAIRFKPLFTEKRIETEFDIKGKISIFIILYHLITLYFDKNFRKLMNSLKKV